LRGRANVLTDHAVAALRFHGVGLHVAKGPALILGEGAAARLEAAPGHDALQRGVGRVGTQVQRPLHLRKQPRRKVGKHLVRLGRGAAGEQVPDDLAKEIAVQSTGV